MPDRNESDVTKRIDLASYIDYALLNTEVSQREIERLCHEAVEYQFKAVFVNPAYTKLAHDLLEGSGVLTGTVCGFPLGATTPEVKIYEAEVGENEGADEIDMVINVGAVRSGDYDVAKREISGVRKALSSRAILKVILECSFLTIDEKIKVAEIAVDCGADFVKTSTGFFGGATVEDVALLFEEVGRKVGIKASGGIRTLKQVMAMIEAGASRLGTSSGVSIIEEYRKRR